ncbi:Pentalenene oxygenase [Caulifigura coniformis]|uniref:Pentalenene oxygenase n=1 Tax=Caulifigura coniformis TaxID=2527983 RepID=A0A517S991_9PLAN|nr:cytochrome P450 [Caulifigura coniformis]QDT52694.1 Pentalenene oxygenase [Caulifigura coniformis]
MATPRTSGFGLWERLARLPGQLLGRNPFGGELLPGRVPILAPGSGRPALPFPHPWNYRDPLCILDSYFHGSESAEGAARHNRYLDFPGFPPVLVTRDPAVIRAICSDTGDQPGQFDRDPLPSAGIARATGKDTLLYSNGSVWRRQRKIAAPPFGKTTLFQPERFHEFEATFRQTIRKRLGVLRDHLASTGKPTAIVSLEPEIKVVMLELLTNNFFGTEIGYDELRSNYVPAIERMIDHIVRDTVTNTLGLPLKKLPALTRSIAQAKRDDATFEELTNLVLAGRKSGKGLWKQFKSDAPDSALRSNLRVFLAGALEATTSYATWTLAHLSRNLPAQEKVFTEIEHIDDYTPDRLDEAGYFCRVLDETLRLTPSLYFLPRQATVDTTVTISDGRTMQIPARTHVLLGVWHANRHDDHWGPAITGYPANEFAPERWEHLAASGRASKEMLHFGFGHGARVCPGKHLGQLEVALVVGAIVKMFRFKAVNATCEARAGVSTKPADGTLVELELRAPAN